MGKQRRWIAFLITAFMLLLQTVPSFAAEDETSQNHSVNFERTMSFTEDFSEEIWDDSILFTWSVNDVDTGKRMAHDEPVAGKRYSIVETPSDNGIDHTGKVIAVELEGIELNDDEKDELLEAFQNNEPYYFTMPDNDISFHVYEQKQCSVKCASSVVGGTICTDNEHPVRGDKVTITAKPDKGYRFSGWNKVYAKTYGLDWTLDMDHDLVSTESEDQLSFYVPDDFSYNYKTAWVVDYMPISVVPVFERIDGTTFSATFDAGGGNGIAPDAIENLSEGDEIVLPDNPFSFQEQTFLGWSDGEKTYQAGEHYTIKYKDVTFTAQWRDSRLLDVWFRQDENDELSTLDIEAQLPGNVITIPKNPSSTYTDDIGNNHYKFAGWSDGDQIYQSGDKYTVQDKSVIFTAVWEKYYKYNIQSTVAGYFDVQGIFDSDDSGLARFYFNDQKILVKNQHINRFAFGFTYFKRDTIYYRFKGVRINGVEYYEDTVLNGPDFFNGEVTVHLTKDDNPTNEGFVYFYLECQNGYFTDDINVEPILEITNQKSASAEIKSFSIAGNEGTIDKNQILIRLPNGIDPKSCTPEIEVSDGATVSPASGETVNLSKLLVYTVTSKNGKVVARYQVKAESTQEVLASKATTSLELSINSYRDSTGALLGQESFLEKVSSTNTDWAGLVLGRYGTMNSDGSVTMNVSDEEGRTAFLEAMKANIEKKYEENDGLLDKVKATEWQRAIVCIKALGGDPTNFGTWNGKPIDLVADGTYNCKVEPGGQGVNGLIWGLLAMNTGDYDIPDDAQYSKEWYIEKLLANQIYVDGEYEGWTLATTPKASDPDLTGMAVQALAPFYNDDTEYTYTNEKTGETLTKTVRQAVDEGLDAVGKLQLDSGCFNSYGSENVESTVQVMVALLSIGKDPLTDKRFIKGTNTLLDGIYAFEIASGGFMHTVGSNWNYMATDQANYGLIAVWRYYAGMRNLYDMRTEFTAEEQETIQYVKDAIADALKQKGEDGYYEALLNAKEVYDSAMGNASDPTLKQYISNYWDLKDAISGEEENRKSDPSKDDPSKDDPSETEDPEKEETPSTEKSLKDNKITASSRTVEYSTSKKTYSIGVKVKGGAKLSYASSNSKIKVSSTGVVTVPAKYVGKTVITIRSAKTDVYKSAKMTVTITVNPRTTAIASLKNSTSRKMSIKWKRNSAVTGYQLQYSTSKNFKTGIKKVTVTKNSVLSKTVSGLKKGKTYYVRIRTYKKSGSTKFYSKWSAAKSVKIRK